MNIFLSFIFVIWLRTIRSVPEFLINKFREILKLFLLDIEANKVSEITRISRPTINKIFLEIRSIITKFCDQNSIFEKGEIELDESYFGTKRVKGKRGRGAGGKIPVFGILKREGKVYTQIVNNCSVAELMPIIEEYVSKDNVIFTDGFKSYDCLVDYGYKRHFRVKHCENEFAKGKNHINGIENFLGLCKVRLSKFRGINKNTFYLHLKECEFRYNYREKTKQELYRFVLKIIRKYIN
jgi:transposase